MKKMISFLIVNWNGGDTLKECINSINDVTEYLNKADYEVIIVDNNSSSLDRSYLESITNIRLIENQSNLMFAVGTNQSVTNSKGNFLFIINNDIILQEVDLNKIIRILETNNANILVPKLLYSNKSLQKSISRIPNIFDILKSSLGISAFTGNPWYSPKFNYSKKQVLDNDLQPMFSALFMTRETWNLVGEMDVNLPLLWNDVDWFYRFHQLRLKAIYLPKFIVLHKHGMSVNKNRIRKILESTKSLVYFQSKYSSYNFLELLFIKLICYFSAIPRFIRELIIVCSSKD